MESNARDAEDGGGASEEDHTDVVTLAADRRGNIISKCQVTDYKYRGNALAAENVVQFFINSYKVTKSRWNAADNVTTSQLPGPVDATTSSVRRVGGRPRHERVEYQNEHPRFMEKERMLRRHGHHNLPNFIGRYFPTRDDPDQSQFYYASMLLLLKPWRNIATDLKTSTETWQFAFDSFLAQAHSQVPRILSGIQYFHQCEKAAQESQVVDTSDLRHRSTGDYMEDMDIGEVPSGSGGATQLCINEQTLADLLASQIPRAEELHGRLALEAAIYAGVFPFDECNDPIPASAESETCAHVPILSDNLTAASSIRRADHGDISNLTQWQDLMSRDVEQQNMQAHHPLRSNQEMDMSADVFPIDEDVIRSGEAENRLVEMSEAALTAVDPSVLNDGQKRAYGIVTWHLDQVLAGRHPPPLRMLLHGAGGTGKSKVIQTITEFFTCRGARHLLLKAAYTGVAASLIDGKTTHTIAMVTRADDRGVSAQTKAKLQQFWRDYEYLIIDEMSMIGKTFLAKLSRNISIGKMLEGSAVSPQSFGGINVILCGDFHQFPPVAVSPSEALYVPGRPQSERTLCQLGRAIYEEFQTVVILQEQMRVTDKIWLDFLNHLHMGRVQEQHMAMLRELVLTNPSAVLPNFAVPPWSDACLVTPRHAVRQQWNEAALRKHARLTGGTVLLCKAHDTVNGVPLSMEERYAFALRSGKREQQSRRRKGDLPDIVELAVGMKVMVTQNVKTDLDITNGARSFIVQIILHPDEPPLSPSSDSVRLKLMPLYILVKLCRTRTSQLPGLDPSVIPVVPTTKSYSIRYATREGVNVTRRVRRQQYPMTCAYAFTDYRSQGQTIPHVIVDIARPPSGGLNLFNLYVALSRSSGRDTIRLLRDFDEKLFLGGHSSDLLAEDDRLAVLDEQNSAWWTQLTST